MIMINQRVSDGQSWEPGHVLRGCGRLDWQSNKERNRRREEGARKGKQLATGGTVCKADERRKATFRCHEDPLPCTSALHTNKIYWYVQITGMHMEILLMQGGEWAIA